MKKRYILVILLKILVFCSIFDQALCKSNPTPNYRQFWENSGLFNYSKNINYDIKRIALHEAGHALVAYLLGLKIIQATINPSRNAYGSVKISLSKNRKKDSISFFLAGYVAEELLFNTACFYAISKNDIPSAAKLCFKYAPDCPEILLQEKLIETRKLIANNTEKLYIIAKTLEDKKTLSGEEIKKLII